MLPHKAMDSLQAKPILATAFLLDMVQSKASALHINTVLLDLVTLRLTNLWVEMPFLRTLAQHSDMVLPKRLRASLLHSSDKALLQPLLRLSDTVLPKRLRASLLHSSDKAQLQPLLRPWDTALLKLLRLLASLLQTYTLKPTGTQNLVPVLSTVSPEGQVPLLVRALVLTTLPPPQAAQALQILLVRILRHTDSGLALADLVCSEHAKLQSSRSQAFFQHAIKAPNYAKIATANGDGIWDPAEFFLDGRGERGSDGWSCMVSLDQSRAFLHQLQKGCVFSDRRVDLMGGVRILYRGRNSKMNPDPVRRIFKQATD